MLKGYKVVLRLRRKSYYKLISSFWNKGLDHRYSNSPVGVQYYVGKWVKRPKDQGPLALFNTLDTAKIFLTHWKIGSCIYECQYEGSEDEILWWNNIEVVDNLPLGTVLADKIKLVKKAFPIYGVS